MNISILREQAKCVIVSPMYIIYYYYLYSYYSDYIHGLLVIESRNNLTQTQLTIFKCLVQLLTQVITMEIVMRENNEYFNRDLTNNKLEYTHLTSAINYLIQSILPPCNVTTLLMKENRYLMQYECDNSGNVEETSYDLSSIIPLKYQTIYDRVFSIPNPIEFPIDNNNQDNNNDYNNDENSIVGLCRDQNRNIMGVIIIDCVGLQGKKYEYIQSLVDKTLDEIGDNIKTMYKNNNNSIMCIFQLQQFFATLKRRTANNILTEELNQYISEGIKHRVDVEDEEITVNNERMTRRASVVRGLFGSPKKILPNNNNSESNEVSMGGSIHSNPTNNNANEKKNKYLNFDKRFQINKSKSSVSRNSGISKSTNGTVGSPSDSNSIGNDSSLPTYITYTTDTNDDNGNEIGNNGKGLNLKKYDEINNKMESLKHQIKENEKEVQLWKKYYNLCERLIQINSLDDLLNKICGILMDTFVTDYCMIYNINTTTKINDNYINSLYLQYKRTHEILYKETISHKYRTMSIFPITLNNNRDDEYVIIMGWCNNTVLHDVNIIYDYISQYVNHLSMLKDMNMLLEDHNIVYIII